MVEFLDSLWCPHISMTTFYMLYFGSFVLGAFWLLTPAKGR